jgi:outer membrane protein assembly factor BamA
LSVGANANYEIQKSVGPVAQVGSESGHTVSGSVSAGRAISEHLQLSFGYNRMHQSYGGIATIVRDPNSDQAYASVSYRFTRPLGR